MNVTPPLVLHQFVDGAALAQGESHRFCVRATGGPLRVTLAWWGGVAWELSLIHISQGIVR